jgi:hypothetical protein
MTSKTLLRMYHSKTANSPAQIRVPNENSMNSFANYIAIKLKKSLPKFLKSCNLVEGLAQLTTTDTPAVRDSLPKITQLLAKTRFSNLESYSENDLKYNPEVGMFLDRLRP